MEREEKTAGRGYTSSARWFPILTVVLVAVYATGVADRPDGVLWDRIYDVGLFNAAYLPAARASRGEHRR